MGAVWMKGMLLQNGWCTISRRLRVKTVEARCLLCELRRGREEGGGHASLAVTPE